MYQKNGKERSKKSWKRESWILQQRERERERERILDITANVASPVSGRNPLNVKSALPELIILYNTDKGLYLGKFV